MRKAVVLAAVVVVAAMMLIGTALAYEVPKEITIKRPDGNQPLSTWVGPVKFPHGEHAVLNPCEACHHKESDKTLGEFVPCTQCHKNPDPNDRTGFFRAWHTEAAPSCLGCHTTKRIKGGKNPVGCQTACHQPQ